MAKMYLCKLCYYSLVDERIEIYRVDLSQFKRERTCDRTNRRFSKYVAEHLLVQKIQLDIIDSDWMKPCERVMHM